MIPIPFPTYWAREFKVKQWSNFFPSATHQIPHIKNWISSKSSPSKLQKAHFQIIPDNFLLSRSLFPSYKDFKKHLKMLKQKLQKHYLSFFILVLTMILNSLLSQGISMKTCVMECHTRPWSDDSKPSSKSLCEALQK